MAAFEVNFDRLSGKVSYKNKSTNIVLSKSKSALSTKDPKETRASGKRWTHGEDWGDEDDYYYEEEEEEQEEEVKRHPHRPPPPHSWDANPYGPCYLSRPTPPPEPAVRHSPGATAPLPQDLARVASRLPDEWECRFDRITWRVYYVNTLTRVSSWEPPPLVPPFRMRPEKAEAVIAEIERLTALREVAARKADRRERRLYGLPEPLYLTYEQPLQLTAPPTNTSLVLFSPPDPSPEPARKKAKKPKAERVVFPWEWAQFRSFVRDANITPEGTFERFCRRQLRELPGVQLEDCQAHWLVLPLRDQKALMAEQRWVLEGARKIFDNRMRAIGVRDPAALDARWAALEWGERQDYLEDAEHKVDSEKK